MPLRHWLENRTLVVAESFGNRMSAFDIGPDGSLSPRRANPLSAVLSTRVDVAVA